MRNTISIFLLSLFTCTILPVKQIGIMLAKNVLTEERNDQAPQTFEEKLKDGHFYSGSNSHKISGADWRNVSDLFLKMPTRFEERIPACPAGDIIIPPPKFLA